MVAQGLDLKEIFSTSLALSSLTFGKKGKGSGEVGDKFWIKSGFWL